MLPPCFPNKNQIVRIPINETVFKKEILISQPLDEPFIEYFLHNYFLFRLYFPYDLTNYNPRAGKQQKNSEKFFNEYLQIDGHSFVFPMRNTLSTNCNHEAFSNISLTVMIDQPLLNDEYLKKYSPVFIYLKKIRDMPSMPLSYSDLANQFAPMFLQCSIGNNNHYFIPQEHSQNHLLDYTIIVSPRIQTDITIKIHDRASKLPDITDFCGSGLVFSYVPKQRTSKLSIDVNSIINTNTSNPAGLCKFHLLPEGKQKHIIKAEIDQPSVIPPGNFYEAQTEMSAFVYDPSIHIKEIIIPNISTPSSPIVTKQVVKSSPGKQKESHTRIEIPKEQPNSEFYRFVIIAHKDPSSNEFVSTFLSYIASHHQEILFEKNLTVLQTYNYETASRKSIDIITGVHIVTPEENMLFIESRADLSLFIISKIISLFERAPPQTKAYLDKEFKFPFPRIYSGFDTLIKTIKLKFGVQSLYGIEGLFFHNSINSILFPLVQKLNLLLEANSLSQIASQDLFPLNDELQQLFYISDALSIPTPLPSAPIESIPLDTPTKRPKTSISRQETQKDQRKPVFIPSGKPKSRLTPRGPRERLHVSRNGDEEIWYVNDPTKLAEPGWEVEIIQSPRRVKSRQ